MGVAWRVELLPVGDDGQEVGVYLSTHGGVSLRSDAIGLRQWRRYLAAPPSWRNDIYAGLGLPYSTGISFDPLRILNPPGPDGAGPMEHLKRLHFDGRPFRAWWAPADPIPPRAHDLWELKAAGTIARRGLGENEIILYPEDPISRLDRPLPLPRYMGLGQCLRYTTASRVTLDDVLDLPGQSMTVEFLVRFVAGDLLVTDQIAMRKDDGANTEGWRVEMNATGNAGLQFSVWDLSPSTVATASGVLAEDGAWHRVRCHWDPAAGELAIYFDNVLVGLQTGVTGALADNTRSLRFGAQSCQCYMTDQRLWSVVRDLADAAADMHRLPEGDEAGLEGAWFSGVSVLNSWVDSTGNGNDGVVDSATYVHSGEGQEADRGRTKPLALGAKSRNVTGRLVSPADRIAHLSTGPIRAVTRATYRGVELFEGTGPGTNYTVDLGTGMVEVHTLFASNAGGLRLDLLGYDDGSSYPQTFAELVEHLLTQVRARPDGRALLTAADLDAASFAAFPNVHPLGFYLDSAEEPPTALDVLQQLSSGVGYVYATADGRIGLGRLAVPGPPADLTLRRDRDYQSLEVLEELLPTLSQRVAYDRCYSVQRDEDLDDGVSPDLRSFVGTEWRDIDWPAPAALIARHQGAVDGERIEALYTRRRHAEEEVRRLQEGIYGLEGLVVIRLQMGRWREGVAPGQVVRLVDPVLGAEAAGDLYFVITAVDFQSNPFGDLELLGSYLGVPDA